MPSPIAAVHSPAGRPKASGAPVAVTLSEAVALALRDNRTIRSAYLDRVAQKFDLVVAQSAFQPRLVITGGMLENHASGHSALDAEITPTVNWKAPTGATVRFAWDRQNRIDGANGGHSDTGSVVVSQPLLRGGGLAVNMAPIRIAELQERINRLNLQATVIDTVTSVVLAYRGLLQAQEQLQLSQASLGRTRSLLDTNRALIAAGRMAAADIVQTEASVANQEVALSVAQQQKQSAQLQLLQLLAVDPRTDIVAADAVRVDHVGINVEQAVALGLDARRDVIAQHEAVEQSRQALLVARNGRLWDVSLTGSFDRTRGEGALAVTDQARTSSSVGLQFNIPIGGPELKQQEVQATTNLRTAQVRYEDLTQVAETQIRDAVQDAEANWSQVEAARRAQDLARQALDNEREKLKAGHSSNFEVLSFTDDLRAADTQALAAAIAYLNALTSLDQLAGSTLTTWHITLND
jgi:outer membrane protein TolC